uniref:Uncharacterized protein n=1 Tax=Rhizophora mucronata TaxID=61149 RepID=A0A2P2Q8I3_RHIMU
MNKLMNDAVMANFSQLEMTELRVVTNQYNITLLHQAPQDKRTE